MLDFKRNETLENSIMNFATKGFMRFLPYTGIHHEIPLYETALHTHEQSNVCYTIIHTFPTDGRLNSSLCLRPRSLPTRNDKTGGV